VHSCALRPSPLPEWSVLSQVTLGVAYALLGTVVAVVLAWTFGPALRDRVSKKPDAPPALPQSSVTGGGHPQAVDTASATSERFITHLKQQLKVEEKEHAKTREELVKIRRTAAGRSQPCTPR
jgi:hypothetical protein